MITIGLTGSIACGKSTVSARLGALGATVIDADAISHELTAPGGKALDAIRARFGGGVFNGDALDRRALGAVVFADAGQRRALEEIIHPLVEREIRAQLKEAKKRGARVAVLDVPLLFECGLDALCDEVFCVWTDEETQLARLCERDGLNEAQARARIRAQMPQEIKLEKSDVHIDTSGPIEQTQARVDALYREIVKPFEKKGEKV